MSGFNFAYAGVLSGLFGFVVGSVFGPVGALFGMLFGLIIGASIYRYFINIKDKVNELESRVDELEV